MCDMGSRRFKERDIRDTPGFINIILFHLPGISSIHIKVLSHQTSSGSLVNLPRRSNFFSLRSDFHFRTRPLSIVLLQLQQLLHGVQFFFPL